MEQNKNSSNLLLWIIIILFGLSIIYLVWDKIKTQKQFKQTILKLEQTAEEKDSLQVELEQMYVQYDNLKTNNDSLNAKLNRQKQKIAQLISELRHVKASDQQKIQQLKQQVVLLKNIMKSYIRQIDSLYRKNQILVAENQKIKHQYTIVLTEKQNLQQVTDSLQKTVKLAQQLEARNESFLALNKHDRKTRRIRRTRKFQVCFTILANKVAKKGEKTIYLRIAQPNGEILINDHSSTFTYQGKEIFYSSARKINYQGKDTNVCIYYLNNTKLPPGKYTAFVFINNHLIFSQEIYLK